VLAWRQGVSETCVVARRMVNDWVHEDEVFLESKNPLPFTLAAAKNSPQNRKSLSGVAALERLP